jgi:hypothetical protein
MKESEYFRQQADIAKTAADNPAFEPWVRAANRAHVVACRRACWEAQEVEALEARLAGEEDPDERLSLQSAIDIIRNSQEARYENAR